MLSRFCAHFSTDPGESGFWDINFTYRTNVQDNGSGVSAAQITNMFQPLNRLGREHSGIDGTGVGLTLVKALIGHMGGPQLVSVCGSIRQFMR